MAGGARDDDVEPAEVTRRLSRDIFHRGRFTHVAGDTDRVETIGTQLFRRRRDALGRPARDDEARAPLAELFRDREVDPARRVHDERLLTRDMKSVVWRKSVSGRVTCGRRRTMTTTITQHNNANKTT